jgi:hypothetical protein
MAEEKAPPLSPMQEGLLRAMRAIDNQIAREMQRTPTERDEEGVLKWKPFETRVEQITAFVLECLGNEDLELDSLLVLSQALTTALRLVAEDLGSEGLGKVRSSYVERAVSLIAEEMRRAGDVVRVEELN